jgi:arabinofuranan 3-O-arabinosyltransferase
VTAVTAAGELARPASPAGQAGPPGADERIRQRIRLVAFSLMLAVLPVCTAPGRIIADTKLDLAIDPGRFLARALTLWDPQQFGQLQDQAAGYLFPMGPFFWAGHAAGLEPWVVQRLWISAVAVTAFLGTVRLAERLGIGSPWTRIAGGLAYAASPAALALLGGLSAEFLPAALLPWILLPLVTAARGGRPGRAAARSALAVALAGGINGAATAAVLLPAVLYILTLSRPAPRWRILAWWCPAVVAATLWWTVPLALLSRYGVSIIPYTESAFTTTSVTGLAETLRGTENWVSYLVVDGQPWWLPGYRLVTGTAPALLTALAAGLGLAGLTAPRLPARRFLLCSVLAGVVIISAGHLTSLGNPLAGPVDQLINGPAAAFRNLRKFDPMIRLPVALGLAHLLTVIRLPRLRTVTAWAAALAIAGLALPAYTGGAAPAGNYSQIPPYWESAAAWLNQHAGRQAVLIEPGAPFGQYTWGSPLDEVLQPLITADWAERNLSVIGSPGNERLLDAVDQQLAAGAGSAALARVLAGMGVRYVVVRNDLNRAVLTGAWPARLSQALASSPGITRMVQFGQVTGSPGPDDAATDFDPPSAAVDIYQVAGASPVVTTAPAATALRVYGGPEALLTLAAEGLPAGRPVLLNADPGGVPAAAAVVTDSLRRRVRNFGELRRSYSPTLTAGQPAATFEATGDYTEPGWARYQAVARYRGGISGVTASSSAADIAAIPSQWASGLQPFAAVDGDPRTAWESGSWNGPVGQWIRVRFLDPASPGTISVAFADRPEVGPAVTRVTITTAAGQVTDRVRAAGGRAQPLRVPPGRTGWLRLTVTGVAGRAGFGTQVAIRELTVPGLTDGRAITAPAPPAGTRPAAVVLAKAQPWPSGCMRTAVRWVCSPALTVPTEEQYGFDHAFTVPDAGQATLRGQAVLTTPLRGGTYPGTGRSGNRRPAVWARASSTYTADPRDQALAAVDGNPATTWIASTTDAQPVLTVGWRHRIAVHRITVHRTPDDQGLLQVLIAGSGGQVRGGNVGPSGVVRFAPMRTRRLAIRFTPLQGPLQITDVTIPGVPAARPPARPLRLGCGQGPEISVNGLAVPTRVTGTYPDVLAGRPVRFTACGKFLLLPGANEVTEPATDRYSVQDVVLARPGARVLDPAGTAAAARVETVAWGSARRVLRVTAGPASYLVVNENFNAGWQAATAGGALLRPVRLDGWKQAWLLPAGTTGLVTLTYRPAGVYRVAVFGGLAALAVIFLLALIVPPAPGRWPRRRARERAQAGPSAPDKPASTAGTAGTAGPEKAAGAAESAGAGRDRRVGPKAAAALTVALAVGLALTGLWLGGWPGAVILPVAAGMFWALPGYGPAAPSGWWPRAGTWLSGPWLLPALLLAASGCALAGARLAAGAPASLAALWLTSGIPQVLGLLIVARLVAELLRQ